MAVNGYTVGRDRTLIITGNNGISASFKVLTMSSSRQVTAPVKIVKMDGTVDHLELPNGWEGSIEVERQDSTMDDYFATLESQYYAGQDILPARIAETITEAGGVLSQYAYTGVMLKYSAAGDYKGDGSVKQKMDFVASRRLKVA